MHRIKNPVKNLFKNEKIEISIRPAQDETEFLFNSPANKKHLLAAIKEVKKNKNLISFTGEEFEKLAEKMISK